MRSDPEIRAKYQIWLFYYATGTPVMTNSAELRDNLDETLRAVDPTDHDAATKRIVVIGHSMGGIMARTLVCSSGERIWEANFRAPAAQLKGDPQTIQFLVHIFHFQRNPRVQRIIFMAVPHRGSSMANSPVGYVGNSITRLSVREETGFAQLAQENPELMTPEGSAFDRGRISAIHTLSPKNPMLIALSQIPVEVPYHSIMGQQHWGAKETGSDGVVPYWSSHLDGAESELVVRSGHQVIKNDDAIREVIRILHQDMQTSGHSN